MTILKTMVSIPEGCDPQVWEQLKTKSCDNITVTVTRRRYDGSSYISTHNITRSKDLLLQNDIKCELCHDWATFYTSAVAKCTIGRADGVHTENPRQARHVVISSDGQWLACNKCEDAGLFAVNKTCCLYKSVTLDEYATAVNNQRTEHKGELHSP